MLDREACMILNMLPGIGFARYKLLCDRFGSPAAVFGQDKKALQTTQSIGEELAERILNHETQVDLKAELAMAEQAKVDVITLFDADYPDVLRQIYDPPLCLYVRGKLPEFPENCLAVVGSRRMSAYGERMTEMITADAVRHGWVIVSGLALGVDTIAHRTAVDLDGVTVAVLGSGLGKPYPPDNIPLAREIIEKGGAVISEFPINFPANRQTFPRRNRIVSALSAGVLVTEAPLDSGALITAQLAADQGRSLFAVPGHADNLMAKGCHKLLREGAVLTESFSDIVAEFEFLPGMDSILGEPVSTYGALASDMAVADRRILELLAEMPLTIEKLQLETELESGELLSIMSRLQIMQKVFRQADQSYALKNV